ncbi:MAG: phosphomannomutase/phosphoglucomutase [Planctomycetota bacterium]|nr:MAG: phosphomannomutase/phosphoglucomutase [Planctomycetota bacterium]
MAGIFKAYDIRGVYPDELDEDIARKIGIALATFLKAKNLVVGRDMRTSAPAIQKAFMEGVTSTGCNVIDSGMGTTPMNYFAIGYYERDGGAQTTASHNPAQYIGFKVSREKAIPLSYETGIGEIEKLVGSGIAAPSGGAGKVEQRDILPDYKKHVLSFADDIKPLKVAVDTGNGVVGAFFNEVFGDLPLEIIPLYFEPDGTFPNHEANPLKAENMIDLQNAVREHGADLGVAFDGDGDRSMYVDEKGDIISSDLITALLAREILAKEPGAGILYDLRSSWVVKEEIEKGGGVPYEDRVGHAYMKATMRRHGCAVGGELSGHYYFRDNYYADSGMIALVKILNVLSAEDKPFSEIIKPLKRYHATGEINFEVEDKDGKMKELERIFSDGEISHLDGISVKYADWWFNVRKSNTEPVLRLNLEAKTPDLMEEKKAEVIKAIDAPII